MIPEWTRRAGCGPEDWPVFEDARDATDNGGTHDPSAVRRAQAVCARCPVVAECLLDAVATDSHEFRAGTSRRQRRSRRYRVLVGRTAA